MEEDLQLKSPWEIKNLIWRACKNALHTKTNLVKRQVVTSDLCVMCKLYLEDIAHTLYRCPKLENFWQNIPLWSHSTIRQSTSFLDIMFVVCAENRDTESVLIGGLDVVESTKQS